MTARTSTRTIRCDVTSRALGPVFDREFARIFTSHVAARSRWSLPARRAARDGTDPQSGGHHGRPADHRERVSGWPSSGLLGDSR